LHCYHNLRVNSNNAAYLKKLISAAQWPHLMAPALIAQPQLGHLSAVPVTFTGLGALMSISLTLLAEATRSHRARARKI